MALPSKLSTNAYLPDHVRRELDLSSAIKPGSPKNLVRYVQERLCLLDFKVRIDGDFGPATAEQLKRFQTKVGLQATGVYDAKEHNLLTLPFVNAINPIASAQNGLGDMIVAVARQHIAQRPVEVGGDNRGPWVRMYMDGHDGVEWKWCAGFAFFAIEQACNILGLALPMEKSFTVDTVVDRAKASNKFYSEKQARKPSGKARIVPGSLFVVRANANHWSHTGIVAQAGSDSFRTCEGNTNDDGSSNGYEAIERVRGYKGKDFIIW